VTNTGPDDIGATTYLAFCDLVGNPINHINPVHRWSERVGEASWLHARVVHRASLQMCWGKFTSVALHTDTTFSIGRFNGSLTSAPGNLVHECPERFTNFHLSHIKWRNTTRTTQNCWYRLRLYHSRLLTLEVNYWVCLITRLTSILRLRGSSLSPVVFTCLRLSFRNVKVSPIRNDGQWTKPEQSPSFLLRVRARASRHYSTTTISSRTIGSTNSVCFEHWSAWYHPAFPRRRLQ